MEVQCGESPVHQGLIPFEFPQALLACKHNLMAGVSFPWKL